MMHDFAITENYTIFMDLPLTFSPERMKRGEPLMMFEYDRLGKGQRDDNSRPPFHSLFTFSPFPFLIKKPPTVGG